MTAGSSSRNSAMRSAAHSASSVSMPAGSLDDQLPRVFQHSVELLELRVLGHECHRLLDRSLCRVPLTKYGVAQGQVVIRACQTGVERHGSCEHLDRRLELASLAAEL